MAGRQRTINEVNDINSSATGGMTIKGYSLAPDTVLVENRRQAGFYLNTHSRAGDSFPKNFPASYSGAISGLVSDEMTLTPGGRLSGLSMVMSKKGVLSEETVENDYDSADGFFKIIYARNAEIDSTPVLRRQIPDIPEADTGLVDGDLYWDGATLKRKVSESA